MKELQFSTEKGEFLLLDGKDTITERLTELLKEYEHYSVVRDMTEEQFAEVVKCSWEHNLKQYSRFTNYLNNDNSYYGSFPTAKESFESLIKSLGWHLFENPYSNFADETGCQEAESKTLYNPILLKKI